MKKKLLTLVQFTDKYGSQEKAAAVVGVDASTYSRWINKETAPHGMAARRLEELGVRL